LSLSLGASPSRLVFPGCFIFDGGRLLWVSYTLLLAFHNVVFVLNSLKVIRQRSLKKFLSQTIYRDGIMFYVYFLGFSLINIIVLNTARAYLKFGLVSFHGILQAILTGKLVINIHRAATLSPQQLELASPSENSELSREIELTVLVGHLDEFWIIRQHRVSVYVRSWVVLRLYR